MLNNSLWFKQFIVELTFFKSTTNRIKFSIDCNSNSFNHTSTPRRKGRTHLKRLKFLLQLYFYFLLLTSYERPAVLVLYRFVGNLSTAKRNKPGKPVIELVIFMPYCIFSIGVDIAYS